MVYKNLKTIEDLNVKGKKVLLRVDLNSQIINKKPITSSRIKEHAKTILELKRKKAKIIVVAHQSRPGRPDFISLNQHSILLNKFTKIKFISDTIGIKANQAINNLKNGQAILLENVRFINEEITAKKNNKIITFFKNKFDIYINDAFSICHRKETSITLLPKLTKQKAIGSVLEKEFKNIEKIKNLKNTLFILGGNKIDDIILLINKKILPTGILALLTLKAKGHNLGKLENNLLKKDFKHLKKIKSNLSHIKQPLDLAFKIKGKRKDISTNDFPINYQALDIGKKTIKLFEEEISNAKRIFWKGTAGDCSKPSFCIGTKRLLKAMEKSQAFSIISGGHSETAVQKFKINKSKLGYISLSGGALIHYLTNKKLPGLTALKI